MSVSLFAGLPQCGHFVLTHSVCLARGDSPFSPGKKSFTSGRVKGKSFSSSGTHPQSSQYTIGIGSPQYLWRENTQSRSL